MPLLSRKKLDQIKVDELLSGFRLGRRAEQRRILRELEVFDVDEHQLIVLETVIKIVKGQK